MPPNHMLSVAALLAILYLFHLAQKDQVLLPDYLFSLLLLEFASSDLVLAQLLFHLEVLVVHYFLLMLDIVLMDDFVKTFLVLLVSSIKSIQMTLEIMENHLWFAREMKLTLFARHVGGYAPHFFVKWCS